MRVNGIIEPLNENQTLYSYLTEKNFDLTKVAVERNGQIVPKEDYKNVHLKDGDTLEIVRFVGGG